MPELPEVNTVQKEFEKVALQQSITEVVVHDDKIIRNVTARQFRNALKSRYFSGSYRQGKYFFGILDNGDHILFHLGMTGDPVYYYDQGDAPRHERFRIEFDSGLILGYNDPRKFSHILVLSDLSSYLTKIKLGPDAMRILEPDFIDLFTNRKTSLKAVLMNQQLISGVGNLYADEICFQAKIHPASQAQALTKRHLKKIYAKMQSILQEACDRNAYYNVYPDDWFWKWRNDKTDTLKGKGSVKKMTIGGRTTYFVDGYQKLVTS